MNDEPIPVWVTVRPSDGVVSVLLLLDTPVGLALYEGDEYIRIGQIKEAEWMEANRQGVRTKKKGYSWYHDEEEYGQTTGREPTKAKALAALLLTAGYREAPPNATNQGLF